MLKLLKNYFVSFIPLVVLGFVLIVIRVFCELEVPNLMSDVVDIGIVQGDTGYILRTGGFMVLWACGAMVADILNSLCAARASMGFGRELRSAVYKRVAQFGITELGNFGTSSLITRTTNDVQQLERFIQMVMTIAMMSPVMLVGAAIMAWMKSPSLSLIVFAAIPVLVVIVLIVVRVVMPLLRSLQRRIDKLNLVTREGLTGVRVIRAYRREGYEEQRFAAANKSLAETNVSVARRMMALMPIIVLLLNIATIIIVWNGAVQVNMGEFMAGDLMALIQYAMQVLMSVMMLSMIFMLWPRAVAAAERIEEVLETKPVIQDSHESKTLDAATRNAAHAVRFENVSFSFEDAEEPALSDVDLELGPGRTYAVIGATGAGKSTLVNLLLRFYEPTQGRVTIDGVDVASMDQDYLRSLISYVPQKTTLFTGTLADNIRYGNEAASEEEVVRAAKNAAAYDFIMEKPDGFDTAITQAGSGLSGGQKQRVAIARALCKPAGLYVFDDSFSALDFKTDAQVRRNLSDATQGATVIVVAQRVSAAMDADQVIVVDAGRIDAVGTHEQLLETSEVYREIVASQLSEEEVG